ncbi:MAG: Stp1/IreP family PP2C-type Ser/Thr phosphatase [Eubacteriales bacterium]
MDLGYKSHIGKVRTVNQDAYLILNDVHVKIFAVADGLGGHNAGEIASNMLLNRLRKFFSEETLLYHQQLHQEKIIQIIKKINEEIYHMGLGDPKLTGMGTTLTMTIFSENCLYLFHVGDSRTYIINEKEILQLTKDHSLVEQLVLQGEITEEEAQSHPNKNILTRAIGTDLNIEIDYYTYSVKSNDKILLCTDGLTNLLNIDTIKDIVNKNSCQESADLLVEKANALGGYDNITLIVFYPEVKR